ncbi:bifunctional phosphopantothenoylcysteine decarboxylase/phosphopantothenate--cysteine ligase CoaBC [Demequina silvatica]|uniref:bifunctional phosphopantothenoylcysteine decarboxylase/phosphopantothenate--cysteine ligase CoaBC n=1 Tax=Demequina silvatica TaxID=1638988 RepID=UPI000785C8D2|nr:bifunctional phosphopantothenoylcysteine decarboxylase/phosphopantothenate--cysteine ligase CoaBC [Demequina silvatica]
MRVLLGVTGGVAAYKAAIVLRRLKEDGHTVRVIPTAAALQFVGRATWEALSGLPATSDTFDNVPAVEHVKLGQQADLVLVAPATADFLAQLAHGEARDLLGNALLATRAPVVVAPAMHTEMWEKASTRANVATLRERGITVIEPAVGRLTGPDSGPGRLPEPDEIVAAAYAALDGKSPGTRASSIPWGDLVGTRVLITAGGTREPIDAVRYLGNISTGHQGFALAEAARERGADVTVVAANVVLPVSEGVTRIDVETSRELAEAVRATASDVVIMAAAVADFRPRETAATKIKKDGSGTLTLELVETEDILRGLVEAGGRFVVGFAAETGDDAASALDHARTKARRKGADLLVFNPVGGGRGFGDVPNEVTILDAQGEEVARAAGSKLAVAHAVLDAVVSRRH